LTDRLEELELRQRALQLRSELLRRRLAREGAALGGTIAQVERGVAWGRQLTRWPVLAGAGALLLAVAGPSRLLRLASRGLVFAGLARRVGALVRRSGAGERGSGR
jgi:hypothetical protein